MSDYPSEPTTREKKHNPFAKFDDEILQEVILPKLQNLYRESSDKIKSKTDMHRLFNEKYSTTVSAATFQWWLEKLGVTFEKTVIVHGLRIEETRDASPPLGARFAPRQATAAADDDVRFDNETQSDFQQPRGFGDAFGLLGGDDQ